MKDNKFYMKKRYTMEHFSHSLIFLPWYNCDFSEGKMYCFGGFSCLNHSCNFPNISIEEWWLKTLFPLLLFSFVEGCHSNEVAGGASSSLCSVTLLNHTMNCKGLGQADSWGHGFSQCRCALLRGKYGNLLMGFLKWDILKREETKKRKSKYLQCFKQTWIKM